MQECCPRERERNEVVSTVCGLVSNMLRKIEDCEVEKQEEYLMKFFGFLWKAKDIASIWEKLINYKAELEKKELKKDIEEENSENKEKSLDTLFE